MAEVNTKQTLGICKYCGQAFVVAFEEIDEEIANERALNECRCPSACAYRARESQKEEAKQNIYELFVEPDERWSKVDDEKIIELMKTAVDLVAENKIRGINMNIPGIGSAKIFINSKDGIVVERKKTDSESATASR